MAVNTELIPKAKDKEKVYYKNGNTWDIVDVVMKAESRSPKSMLRFAKQFPKSKRGLEKLWEFVKYKITYKVDADGRQDILMPSNLWERGWGDCKSKTIFIAQVLKCLGIDYVIRFTSYDSDNAPTHVYPVAYLNGEEIIVDSVWDFFDREKSYTHKTDKEMTKISMIGRLPNSMRTPDLSEAIKKRMQVLEQKRANAPKQEIFDLVGTSVGEAKALFLRRQLQLLKSFNPDNAVEYNKSLALVERALKQGVMNSRISGVGVLSSQTEQAVARLIETKLKNPAPAFSWQRTSPRIGALNTLNLPYLKSSFDPTKFSFGANTQYAQPVNKVAKAVYNWLVANKDSALLDAQGNPVMQNIVINPFTGATASVPVSLYGLTYKTESSTVFGKNDALNYLAQLSESQRASAITTPNMGRFFQMSFPNNDNKVAFEKWVEENSGVWQEYLQRTVFKEEGQVGGGILYAYGSNVQSMNKYTQSVNSKSVVQSQWLDGVQYLTGGDRGLLEDMARNTYIYTSGENPEDSLSKLIAASSPNIGALDPVTISAIIGLISTIITLIAESMNKTRQQADELAPDRALGVAPVGGAMMPNEQDWEGADNEEGADQNTIIGLAIAAAAAWYMTKKK